MALVEVWTCDECFLVKEAAESIGNWSQGLWWSWWQFWALDFLYHMWQSLSQKSKPYTDCYFRIMGKYGYGDQNEHRERLLELAWEQEIVVCNANDLYTVYVQQLRFLLWTETEILMIINFGLCSLVRRNNRTDFVFIWLLIIYMTCVVEIVCHCHRCMQSLFG